MFAETEERQPLTREAKREAIIREVIEEIRPNLKRDGGDCELVEIDGNKVMVKMTGACVFCKLASETIEGIQTKIVERLGELIRLIPVAGAQNKPLVSLKALSPAPSAAPLAPAPAASPVR
ncbi:NifU family protein [Xanthobacter dioxanivorans]|uniref:NifU family protein n=1 Tax=Xanthobacter dioxanivorans TaxID=2528964 RepID=A0A974PQE5_9HYPH|nr:NifU family protein [Xanthobacter dioxanivorans]QRG07591.1 NifU family protein [Xanthobacter dioxanivorans]